MESRRFAVALTLAAPTAGTAFTCAAEAACVGVAIDTGVPPPPPQVETVSPLRPGSVWIHDHWRWANGADVWIAGHWMERRPRWRYVQTRRRPCGPNGCDNAGSPGLLKIGSC